MGRYSNSGLGYGTGGSPQGTLDQNEYNNAVDNLTNKFPPNDSQIKHIFKPKEGHLSDTPENRKLIETVANDLANYKGKDKYGNEWYSRNEPNGSQVWVITRNVFIKETILIKRKFLHITMFRALDNAVKNFLAEQYPQFFELFGEENINSKTFAEMFEEISLDEWKELCDIVTAEEESC